MLSNTTRQGHKKGQKRRRLTAADREHRERVKRDAARLDRELRMIEQAEQATLVRLGHGQTDFDALSQSVYGVSLDAAGKRARLALGTLLHLRQLRWYVAEGNAVMAAFEAVRVGAYSGGILLDADAIRFVRRRGGTAKAAKAAERRAEWQRIANTLARGKTKNSAAIQVLSRLGTNNGKKLPSLRTIANSITYP